MFSAKGGLLLQKAQGNLSMDLQALDASSSRLADWFKEQLDRFKEEKTARCKRSTLRHCQAWENDLDTDSHCHLY